MSISQLVLFEYVHKEIVMSLILTDSQEVALSVTPVSKAGNAVAVETPAWSSSDPLVIEIQVDEKDPLKVLVKTTGKVGSVQFSCDARIGEGVSPRLSTLDVEVVAGEAVNLKIDAATPTDKA
jgi:hypothetical protein